MRGSSKKEKINLIKVLMCYMMHGKTIYCWTDNGDNILETISINASNLYYMSDDTFFFLKTKEMKIGGKKVEHSNIYMIES